MRTERFAHFNPAANPSECTEYLQRMAEVVDFAALARAVDEACPRSDDDDDDHLPYATECVVKTLFLQVLYGNLSDEEMACLLRDRHSWREFTGIAAPRGVPDAMAIGRFKQRLAPAGGAQAIFDAVAEQLEWAGYVPQRGRIKEATVIDAPAHAPRGPDRYAVLPERREKPDRRRPSLDPERFPFDTRQGREQRGGLRIDCRA